MKYFPIVTTKNPIIYTKCVPINIPISAHICEIIAGMERLVDDSNVTKIRQKYRLRQALGVAANQVGYSIQMFYIRASGSHIFFINPVVTEKSWQKSFLKGGEGCLSVRDQEVQKVLRHHEIKIKYYNYKKKQIQTELFSGLQSIVIQHELDHLNGITYLERVSEQKYFLQQSNKTDLSAIQITR